MTEFNCERSITGLGKRAGAVGIVTPVMPTTRLGAFTVAVVAVMVPLFVKLCVMAVFKFPATVISEGVKYVR